MSVKGVVDSMNETSEWIFLNVRPAMREVPASTEVSSDHADICDSLWSRLGANVGQFRQFLLVGILNTVFGYFVYAVFVLSGVTPSISLFVATCVGIIFNFSTTGRWVFRKSDVWAFPRFVLAYLITYIANWALLNSLLVLGVPALAAQALPLPVIVIFTFFILRFFVFRR